MKYALSMGHSILPLFTDFSVFIAVGAMRYVENPVFQGLGTSPSDSTGQKKWLFYPQILISTQFFNQNNQ